MKFKKIAIITLLLITMSACASSPVIRGDSSKLKESSSETSQDKLKKEEDNDNYNVIEVTTEYEDDTYYWAINTDAKTLGAALDESAGLFKLKKEDGKRVLYSYRGKENTDSEKWIFLKNDCEENSSLCIVENIDTLQLNGDSSFISFYGDKSKITFE